MKKIILFAFIFISQLAFASTNEFNMDKLEYEFDRGQCIDNADALINIYTNICAQVSSSQLVRVEYDGANALFVTYAGLARAYFLADRNLTNGHNYALRARTLGYGTGVAATNPERFANLLHILSLYYEKAAFASVENAQEYHNETWETWPYFNNNMLNLWRRKRAVVYYNPTEAIPITLEVVENEPFVNTLFYRNCGWHYSLLEDYRNAFSIWFRGLKDGEPHYWNSPTPERIIQYIEHATLDELKETKRLFRVNAAKYPATMENVKGVTGWVRWAENPHLNFEIKLREVEEAGNALLVTNMLRIAVSKYRRPLYAKKLGDYDKLVELYCKRMKEQIWWWSMPEYSLLPKVEAIIESSNVTTNTVRLYLNTLKSLADKPPKYTKRVNLNERINNIESSWDL